MEKEYKVERIVLKDEKGNELGRVTAMAELSGVLYFITDAGIYREKISPVTPNK